MSDTILDFYQCHEISPVRQDIADLPAHFARRAGLYRALGLPPIAIRKKWVLDVGPGSGENALYTRSLKPDRYVLLEPNPTAAKDLHALFDDDYRVDVEERSIERYPLGYRFDVVICEGLLGLCGGDPKALLEQVARHVVPGGVLVITCIDPISDCAEVLRRAMAHRLIDRSAPLAEQVNTLRPVFAPHLATLNGMTRSVDDWIVDNLLNPASIGPTFSIPEALTALEGRFDLLGCSPRFLVDWRWYKNSAPGNSWAIDAYWKQCHNLIDYRRVSPERSEVENRDLMDQCLQLRDAAAALERGEPDEVPQLYDIGWFGRGQQYLSLVRR